MNKLIGNPEKEEQQFAEEAWYSYLNKYLLQTGVISMKEYECMIEKIAAKFSRLAR